MKELIILFWQARLLDIFELNYVASNEKMGTINKPIRTLKKKRICFHIISFLASFCKQLIKYVFIKKETGINEEILVFFTTTNQNRALTPIFEKLPNTRIISETSKYVPLFNVYLFTIPYIPLMLYHFYQSKGYKRESFYYFFDGYLCVYGYYLLFRLLFLKSKIKIILRT